ncbi:MipA/OmpV family protein [Piscinibacter sakaiensis]|uniref:Putative outer membrane protein n=1 Tax=Piscinibacter sakaiensis TaxID=1547922 RepID=A0A0K8P3Y9_PISS1|nr:MipA/OmpV family protein [Piscinibacter sakaiensis]GAP37301.1 putative outer membrane protein [Piscinibacter sakaiensis]
MPAPAATQPLWELGIGVAGLRLPHYRGSAQSQAWLLPAPYAVYRGEVLRADRDGLRARLIDHPDVDLDLSLGASAPTRSEDNEARRGMADLKPSLEFGPQLQWRLLRRPGWTLDLRVPVRAAFTLQRDSRYIGWVAAPVLNLDTALPSGWRLGLQAGPLYGDRRQHAYFYDVGAADVRPGRPAYAARGGYAGAKALAAVSRRVGDTWFGAFVRADTLSGAVFADSPLVTQRSGWAAGLAVSWVLATSERRVPSRE